MGMNLIWTEPKPDEVETDRTLSAVVAGETITLGRVYPDKHAPIVGYKRWANARAIIWRWENTAPKSAGGSVIRGARSTEAAARAALEKSIRTCCLADTVADAVDRLTDDAPPKRVLRLARMDKLARALRDERTERTYRRLEALIGGAA